MTPTTSTPSELGAASCSPLFEVALTYAEWLDIVKQKAFSMPHVIAYNIEQEQWVLMQANLISHRDNVDCLLRLVQAQVAAHLANKPFPASPGTAQQSSNRLSNED